MILSPAERRVVALAAQGRFNAEIASDLFISVNTVKFHMRNVTRRHGYRNRVELALAYVSSAQRIEAAA